MQNGLCVGRVDMDDLINILNERNPVSDERRVIVRAIVEIGYTIAHADVA